MAIMNRLRFTLTSDQLELLMAFESSQGLNNLAETMAKDPSVISRNLQRIAEEAPVLKKVKGRWELTPLGIQMNEQTRSYLAKHTELLSQAAGHKKTKATASDRSILIIINVQNGLLDATQEGRNNSEAEKNISQLLSFWRSKNREVIHVKHVSDNPSSSFFRNSLGCDFIESLAPQNHERIVEKTKSSAFSGTDLESLLSKEDGVNIVLAGFTANECIDATARDASALGFESLVVGDATAMFDVRDTNGKLLKAERVHRLTLANINALYAKVVQTKDLCWS